MTSSAVRFGSRLYASYAQVREAAQGYFFKVLREVCPEVLYSLRGDLFPLYRELAGRHPGTRGAGVPPELQSFLELERQEPALAKRVLNWCAKFHLVGQVEVEPEWHGPDWFAIARANGLWPALRIHETLVVWSRPLGSRWLNADPPQWPQISHWRGRSGARRMLVVPIAEPEEFNSAAAFLEHMMRACERQLRGILASQKDRAKQGGLIRASIKTRPDQFTWLALRQVKGWSSRAIAEWHAQVSGEAVEVDSVRKDIVNAAESIGLRPRPLPVGRPRKLGNRSA
jgi:hypothetical protein